jgi:hypothetical protein
MFGKFMFLGGSFWISPQTFKQNNEQLENN